MLHEESSERYSVSHGAHPSQPLPIWWTLTRASSTAPRLPSPERTSSPARLSHPPLFINDPSRTEKCAAWKLLVTPCSDTPMLRSGLCLRRRRRSITTPHLAPNGELAEQLSNWPPCSPALLFLVVSQCMITSYGQWTADAVDTRERRERDERDERDERGAQTHGAGAGWLASRFAHCECKCEREVRGVRRPAHGTRSGGCRC
ncbi:hypothetical protein NDU88_011546 [Pleurodeles waltl]|uniref:Uncharacterized protein n=1 Tax=Pleurodeles waltl TaxID=8319 RepID=A0AAV7Q1Z7_PLEWA|nr:hypothetical protein NDU88_011546 [Pleurodeles waltl]